MNIEGVPEIIAAVLEDEDEDLVKDVSSLNPDSPGHWEQVDGDWGDPWLYGASWYNQVKRLVLHFDGVESEEEIDPDDVKVPEEMMAKLALRFPPDPWIESDEAKQIAQEDPKWMEKFIHDDEWDRERETSQIIGNYQYARAAFLNDREQREFHEFEVEDEIPHSLQRYEEGAAQSIGMTPEAWANMPVFARMIEIGRYHGFHNLSSQTKMNKLEAQRLLGTKL